MSWGGSFGGGGGSFGGGGGSAGGSFHTFSAIQQHDSAPTRQDNEQPAANTLQIDPIPGQEVGAHTADAAKHLPAQDAEKLATNTYAAPTASLNPTSTDWTRDLHEVSVDDGELARLAYPKAVYKKRLAKNHFRLIQLTTGRDRKPLIELHEYRSLSECPPYVAISWCWGNSRSAYYVKMTNYAPDIVIRPNGYAALHHLSRDTEQASYYWIDAICINQQDPIEKAHQVGMMGHIYFQAEKVIAFVGNADDTSRALFRQAKTLADKTSAHATAHDARALLKFMERPWFSRSWVVQETLLARKIDLRVGSDKLRWADFEAYYNRVAGSSAFRTQGYNLIQLRQWYIHHSARMLGPLRVAYVQSANMMDDLPPIGALEHYQLFQLMQRTWNFEAGVRRDKIYSMLSLFSEPFPQRLLPDYTKRKNGEFKRANEKVFAALSVFMLEQCDCQMWSIGWKGIEWERKMADKSSLLKRARGVALRVLEPVLGS